jgi:hypothetical protein
MPAEPAVTIDAADPRNADACADGQQVRGALDNFANNLVAGDQLRLQRRQVLLDDVQIGPADSASQHAQQHMTRLRLWPRDVFDLEKWL